MTAVTTSSVGVTRADLAGKWAGALTELEYVPVSPAAAELTLLGLIDAAVDLIEAPEFDRAAAQNAGAHLVACGYRAPVTLQASMEVLGRGLPMLTEFVGHADPERLDQRIVAFLGALAAG